MNAVADQLTPLARRKTGTQRDAKIPLRLIASAIDELRALEARRADVARVKSWWRHDPRLADAAFPPGPDREMAQLLEIACGGLRDVTPAGESAGGES